VESQHCLSVWKFPVTSSRSESSRRLEKTSTLVPEGPQARRRSLLIYERTTLLQSLIRLSLKFGGWQHARRGIGGLAISYLDNLRLPSGNSLRGMSEFRRHMPSVGDIFGPLAEVSAAVWLEHHHHHLPKLYLDSRYLRNSGLYTYNSPLGFQVVAYPPSLMASPAGSAPVPDPAVIAAAIAEVKQVFATAFIGFAVATT
jgi:hypothetical protein